MFKTLKLIFLVLIITFCVVVIGPRLKKSGLNFNEISQSLDGFISQSGNTPVVLGLKISDTSLDTIINVIHGLPPNEIAQIKNFICTPATPSSSKK